MSPTPSEAKLRRVASGESAMSNFRSTAELSEALKSLLTSYDHIREALDIEKSINNKIRNGRDTFFSDVSQAVKKYSFEFGE